MADNNELSPLSGHSASGQASLEEHNGGSGNEPVSGEAAPQVGRRQWEVNLRNIWPAWGMGDTVAAVRRIAREVDRRVDDAGFGPGWLNRRFGGDPGAIFAGVLWTPQIEMFQRGDQIVVRVDLPGVAKGDVRIHWSEGSLTIEGERRQAEEETRSSLYRSERSYGHFARTIPLPAGGSSAGATARLEEGVLEVVLQAPEQEKGEEIPIQ